MKSIAAVMQKAFEIAVANLDTYKRVDAEWKAAHRRTKKSRKDRNAKHAKS